MKKLHSLLGASALVALALGLYVGLWSSPPDAFQRDYVRIMYVHVPTVSVAYISFTIVAISSVLFLFRRETTYDQIAHSAAELGVLFTGLALATGSIWGKAVWGTWWTWDARLVTTAILFLVYVGYLLVRELAEDRERGARLASVIGIIGFVDIPIIHFSVVWFRTLHQPASITRGDIKLAAPMLVALILNIVAFMLLYIYLLIARVRLERLEAARLLAVQESTP